MRELRSRTSPDLCVTSCEDAGDLEVRFINSYIGSGVFALTGVAKKRLVAIYNGELISDEEGQKRHNRYNPSDGSFLFFFKHKKKRLCVDATYSSGFGRMINDDPKHPNCKVVVEERDGQPTLCIYSIQQVMKGDQIFIDYKDSTAHWRKKNNPRYDIYTCPGEQDMESESTKMLFEADDIDYDPDSGPSGIREDDDEGEGLQNTKEPTNTGEGEQDMQFESTKMLFEADDIDCDPDSGPSGIREDDDEGEGLQNTKEPTNTGEGEQDMQFESTKMLFEADDIDCDPDSGPSGIREDDDEGEGLQNTKEPTNTGEGEQDMQSESTKMLMEADDIDCDPDSGPSGIREDNDGGEGLQNTKEPTNTGEGEKDMQFESTKMLFEADDIDCDPDSGPSGIREDDDEGEGLQNTKEPTNTGEVARVTHINTSCIPLLIATRYLVNEDEYSATIVMENDIISKQSTSTYDGTLQFENLYPEDEDFITDDDCVNDPDFTLKESDYVSGTSGSDSETSEIIPCYPMLEMKQNLDSHPSTKVSKEREKDLSTETTAKIKLQPSRNEKDKRIWDKLHYCVYCKGSYTNLLKHLFGRHKLEEVKKIKDMPKSSKQRSNAILKLRNAGDYKHNIAVLKSGSGTLVTWSRKGDDYSPHDYLPCEDCLGFFVKEGLWRHRQNCPLNVDRHTQRRVQSGAYLMLPTSATTSQGLKENVLKKMAADEISIAVRNDSLILRVGEKLFQKHGQHQHLSTYISQKMRELGRFLICARKADPEVRCLNDAVRPEKFLKANMATKDLCKYDEETNTFGNPSLAMKIGHSLKKCARIKKSDGLIEGDEEKCKQAENFLMLLENEWTDEVSSSALQTLHGNRRNQGQVLPLTEDVMKLRNHLVSLSSTLVSSLQEKFSQLAFENLNQVTLARLVLFNRRRGGETQRLTLEAYSSRKTSASALEEIEDILNDREKALCSTLTRVEIRGKRGRTVPVLITPALELSINVLLDKRVAAGIHPENPYLFPRPNFDSCQPIRSTDALRRFAVEAELLQPKSITSTKLRKHVATVAQVLDLSEHDIETMSGFLGHDIRVHRDFYRLPQETLQVVKMGRLLNAVDKGTLSQYRGMALEDIPVNEDAEFSSDEDSESDEGDNVDDEELVEHENYTQETELESPSGTDRRKKGKKSKTNRIPSIVRLSSDQSRLLKSLFQANVDLRKELRRAECEKVISRYQQLKDLTWTKLKTLSITG